MRKFIDNKGTYIIDLPDDWFHKNVWYGASEKEPDSFELMEKPVGTFQISVNDASPGKIPELIKNNNVEDQEYGKKELKVVERVIETGKFSMYMWFVKVDNNFLMAKYIFDTYKKNYKKVKTEIVKSKNSLQTLIFIPKEIKEEVITKFQFDKFMFSLAAAGDLISRAYKSTNPIELVVLLANQIDALLRLCLILHDQLETNSSHIDIKLIFQKDDDKVVMEKAIYRLALEKGIINDHIYDKLFNLYNQRNKVIHRYIISDLTTKDVYRISIEYNQMEKTIGNIVRSYEQKQYDNKVGIYGHGELPTTELTEEQRKVLQMMVDEKHSHRSFIEKEK